MRAVVVLLASAMVAASAMAIFSQADDSGSARAAPLSVSVELEIFSPYTVKWWNNGSIVKVHGWVEYEEVPKGWVELTSLVSGLSSSVSPQSYDIQGTGSFAITVAVSVSGLREDKSTTISVEGQFVYYVWDTEYRMIIEPFQGEISFIVLERPESNENTTTRHAEDGVTFDPLVHGQYIIPVVAVLVLVVVALISVRLYLRNRKRRKAIEAARRARYLDPPGKEQ